MSAQASFVLRGRNPDVLTCIANLSNDEVFTPPEFANRMLDTLAEAWAASRGGANLWADKTATFLDPCAKSGVFLREIASRLTEGLADEIPNLEERVNHILTNQIAVDGVPTKGEPFKEFMRRVREAVGGVDKSASGASRLAGVENWKEKYLPEPPVVAIVQGVPGRVMTAERLQELGLLAEPEPVKLIAPARVSAGNYDRPWPSYQITLSRTRPKKDGSGPDRSLADFNWAMTSCTGGKSIEDTVAKLLEVSENAQQRAARGDEGYVRITVENAAAAVAKNWGRNRA
jgi:hypothetical protein